MKSLLTTLLAATLYFVGEASGMMSIGYAAETSDAPDDTVQNNPPSTFDPFKGIHFCDSTQKVCIHDSIKVQGAPGVQSVVVDNVFSNGLAYVHPENGPGDPPHQIVVKISDLTAGKFIPADQPINQDDSAPPPAPSKPGVVTDVTIAGADTIHYVGRASGYIARDASGTIRFFGKEGTYVINDTVGTPTGVFRENGFLVRESNGAFHFVGRQGTYVVRDIQGTPKFAKRQAGYVYRDAQGAVKWVSDKLHRHNNQNVANANPQTNTNSNAAPPDPTNEGADTTTSPQPGVDSRGAK